MLILKVLLIIVSIVLIVAVLLQSGKSAGLSGAIDGGATSMFGGKGKALDSFLNKLTVVMAVLFMLLSLVIVAIQ
ncbi:preprotein translocase subunit SecG [Natroniella acetigena]|uniref:preprotein translocase subunit SecG n=1 Tax=Natroniella acetigena TaxID=52004 RepID=UPI00200B1366|nr:preprotein translocase subunit SecG [Natroniella acetigena]